MPLTKVFWLMDYDGSLCPHREAWEIGSYDPAELFVILSELSRFSAGLMWNTGRMLDSLSGQCADFLKFPGFFEHGATYWDTSQSKRIVDTELSESLKLSIEQWASSRQSWMRLEYKPQSLRLIPVSAQDLSRLKSEFLASGIFLRRDQTKGDDEFYVSQGWRALEVVCKGVNKSNAVDYLSANHERFQDSLPVAIGDDIGDFEVVSRVLARGGMAYLVGSHCGWISEIPHKASQVKFFRDPQALLKFLQKATLDKYI